MVGTSFQLGPLEHASLAQMVASEVYLGVAIHIPNRQMTIS